MQHDMPIWPWIMRAVGWTWTRFHVRASGRTAYEEYTDSSYTSEIAVLGETVYFKEAASATGQCRQGLVTRGANTAWRKGTWVGKSENSNQHVVMTDDGTRYARTVRRLPPDRRYQKEVLLAGKGVPLADQAGTAPGRLKKRPVMAPVAPVAIPAVAPAEVPSAGPEGADVEAAPDAQDTVPTTSAAPAPTPSSSHGEKRAAEEQLGPTPEMTPQTSSASAGSNESNLMSLSPTRQAFLEREREAWRNHAEQDEKKPRVGQIQSGPTHATTDSESPPQGTDR